MSYAAINPAYYQMLTPDSPWHPGAEGWSSAPWPGWGENPNLVGPPRLAVNGTGGGCGCGGAVGYDADNPPPKPPGPKGRPMTDTERRQLDLEQNWPLYAAGGIVAIIGAVVIYKRVKKS